MRVLDTTTYELTDDSDARFLASPVYAILSHRWFSRETSFQDYDPATLHYPDSITQRFSPQAWKLRGACAQARVDGLKWLWVDTCCINKESSAELSEAINSMFRWYRDAKVCYVYLHDVSTGSGLRISDMNRRLDDRPQYSEWFSRGWTLQELLAPRVLAFFDHNWGCIGSRTNLARQISDITGIDSAYLTGRKSMRDACIATKMSWMARRKTTRIEDMAYSLLGIFDINLTPVYGEREKSFLRLQKALLQQTSDESLFAWAAQKSTMPRAVDRSLCRWGEWGLLAPSPRCFKGCGDLRVFGLGRYRLRADGGLSWTQQGIRVPVSADDDWEYDSRLDWVLNRQYRLRKVRLTLNCWRKGRNGEWKVVQIFLHKPKDSALWTRYRLDEFSLSHDIPDSGVEEIQFTVGSGEGGTALTSVSIVVYQPVVDDTGD